MIPVVIPIIVPPRKCPACGQKVGTGDRVCAHCGHTLPEVKGGPLVAAILVGLFALLAGVFLLLRSSGTMQTSQVPIVVIGLAVVALAGILVLLKAKR
jgi:predicted nucleic acid-binding Zn ribbon protein